MEIAFSQPSTLRADFRSVGIVPSIVASQSVAASGPGIERQ